jgi:hypothetical protein
VNSLSGRISFSGTIGSIPIHDALLLLVRKVQYAQLYVGMQLSLSGFRQELLDSLPSAQDFADSSQVSLHKGKAVPLQAMEALGGRGGIDPTHSRPRH